MTDLSFLSDALLLPAASTLPLIAYLDFYTSGGRFTDGKEDTVQTFFTVVALVEIVTAALISVFVPDSASLFSSAGTATGLLLLLQGGASIAAILAGSAAGALGLSASDVLPVAALTSGFLSLAWAV